MKRNFKKYIIITLVVILSAGVLLGCSSCDPTIIDPPGPVPININILPDLADLSVNASDYAPGAVNYGTEASTQSAKLLAKQDSEKIKHHYVQTALGYTNYDAEEGKYNWIVDGEDTTTFTKIFLFSDVDDLIARMAAAALPTEKMKALVTYITREDPQSTAYLMASGTGSAIRDYEELDELYDIYDEDDSDDNYVLLQQKRRKVMHEVFGIFGNDAAAASRTGIELLSYAQKVVADVMITDYTDKTGNTTDFYGFFKGELFDYDTLSYFLAFNETCGATGQYLLSGNYVISPVNKKEMTKLYGYYYQYQKREFDLFTDAQYFEYLDLSLLDYYQTDADALKYRDYDRTHYEGAYRYSASFYKKYYETHFLFQSKQEKQDKRVYVIDPNWDTSYAVEMQKGCVAGMEATLKLSDVNWEYTAKNSNVTNYNTAAKEYYTLSKTDRDNKTNPARIALVHLRIEQLKSQQNTVTHKTITTTDLGNALKYQIYSFSGDYARTLLSNRKDDVYMTAELNKMDLGDTVGRAEKTEEIGRNEAMFQNNRYFYVDKGNVTHQLEIAGSYNWTEISQEMATTLAFDYDNYHSKHMSTGAGSEVINGVTVSYVDPVDVKFEDTLIAKDIVDDSGTGANSKKEYDTDWEISRLLDNHENVFRYAYGQIAVNYMEASDLNNYTLDGAYVTDNAYRPTTNIIDPESPSFGINTTKAISTSEISKFSNRASNYTNYQEETFDSDEGIELAKFASGVWAGILPSNGNVDGKPSLYNYSKNEQVSGSQRTYDYYLIFEGWYVDKDLQYKANLVDGRFGEEYDYDIRLYPGYKVVKVLRAS